MNEEQELLQDEPEGMRNVSREELAKRQADAVRWSRNVGLSKGLGRCNQSEMMRCKTCKHWKKPEENASCREDDLCTPRDPDTYEPMDRGFEVRLCKLPTQTFCEAPV
jgi:hypothetical protein